MTFKPTYLYIKQHTVTGMLYFGKTSEKNPEKYHGSGRHWVNHFKKHGKEHIETLWYCHFIDEEECTKFALKCSEIWDIVKSDQWANLIPENGLDDRTGCHLSSETKDKIAAKLTGFKYGPQSSEHKAKITATKIGRKRGPQSPEQREKTRIRLTGKIRGPYKKRISL